MNLGAVTVSRCVFGLFRPEARPDRCAAPRKRVGTRRNPQPPGTRLLSLRHPARRLGGFGFPGSGIPLGWPESTYARFVRNAPAVTFAGPASGVVIDGCRVLAGSSSWADRSLVRDGSFYPTRSLSAAQRLLHYAGRLPLTEVATTYRFPPTPDVAKRWVASTPAGFTMDVRAWSLLSGAPTWPESLWADLQGHVRPSRREGVKLYRHHLPAGVLDECWDRFNHAVRPLAEAGRLGAIIVRFPSWFRPRLETWEELAGLPSRLPGLRIAVELTNERWFEGDACEQTLGLLEEFGLCFVCKDGPGPATPIVAATSEVGFVRFTGSPGLRRGPRPSGECDDARIGRGSGNGLREEPGVGRPAGEVATDRGGDRAPASGRSLGLGPRRAKWRRTGAGMGPRLREEPGVGAPGGRSGDGPGRGWAPRLREEPGVGAPGGRSGDGPGRGWAPASGRSLGLGPQAGEVATDRGGDGRPASGRSLGLGPQAGEVEWSYRYSEAELAAWAPAIRELASCTSEVHVIMDNCWRANAVDNATSLLGLLAR